MINTYKTANRINLIICLLLFITVLHSCKGQDKKHEYNPKAIEMNNKAIKYAQSFKRG